MEDLVELRKRVMFKGKEKVADAIRIFADNWNIPLDQVTVGGGAALVLRGIREETHDLNLWVDSPHFEKLCEEMKTINHPMTDTVIMMPNVFTYVRQRNRYFEHDVIAGIQVFNVLALIVQKRGGYAEHARPVAKRKQDRMDLRILAEIHAQRNKVA